jgi:hypothetical protein
MNSKIITAGFLAIALAIVPLSQAQARTNFPGTHTSLGSGLKQVAVAGLVAGALYAIMWPFFGTPARAHGSASSYPTAYPVRYTYYAPPQQQQPVYNNYYYAPVYAQRGYGY